MWSTSTSRETSNRPRKSSGASSATSYFCWLHHYFREDSKTDLSEKVLETSERTKSGIVERIEADRECHWENVIWQTKNQLSPKILSD